MGTLTAIFKYQEKDITKNFNKRISYLSNKNSGIFELGYIDFLSISGTTVTINAFTAISKDGMLVSHEGTSEFDISNSIDYSATDSDYYITLKAVYVSGGEPVLEFVGIKTSSLNSNAYKDYLLIIGKVHFNGSSLTKIDYTDSYRLSPLSREFIKGVVANTTQLPQNTSSITYLRENDMYFVEDSKSFAVWNGSNWITLGAIPYSAPVSIVPDGTNSAGVDTLNYSLADHVHNLTTYSSNSSTISNSASSPGTSGEAPARGDHVHYHGQLTGGDLHNLADNTSHGFEDKTSVDFKNKFYDYPYILRDLSGYLSNSNTVNINAGFYSYKGKAVSISSVSFSASGMSSGDTYIYYVKTSDNTVDYITTDDMQNIVSANNIPICKVTYDGVSYNLIDVRLNKQSFNVSQKNIYTISDGTVIADFYSIDAAVQWYRKNLLNKSSKFYLVTDVEISGPVIIDTLASGFKLYGNGNSIYQNASNTSYFKFVKLTGSGSSVDDIVLSDFHTNGEEPEYYTLVDTTIAIYGLEISKVITDSTPIRHLITIPTVNPPSFSRLKILDNDMMFTDYIAILKNVYDSFELKNNKFLCGSWIDSNAEFGLSITSSTTANIVIENNYISDNDYSWDNALAIYDYSNSTISVKNNTISVYKSDDISPASTSYLSTLRIYTTRTQNVTIDNNKLYLHCSSFDITSGNLDVIKLLSDNNNDSKILNITNNSFWLVYNSGDSGFTNKPYIQAISYNGNFHNINVENNLAVFNIEPYADEEKSYRFINFDPKAKSNDEIVLNIKSNIANYNNEVFTENISSSNINDICFYYSNSMDTYNKIINISNNVISGYLFTVFDFNVSSENAHYVFDNNFVNANKEGYIDSCWHTETDGSSVYNTSIKISNNRVYTDYIYGDSESVYFADSKAIFLADNYIDSSERFTFSNLSFINNDFSIRGKGAFFKDLGIYHEYTTNYNSLCIDKNFELINNHFVATTGYISVGDPPHAFYVENSNVKNVRILNNSFTYFAVFENDINANSIMYHNIFMVDNTWNSYFDSNALDNNVVTTP